jgi:hypothetical protein
MLSDWNILTDDVRVELARQALAHAADTLAGHAEVLAREMELGHIVDRGGPDALRLFAAILKVTGCEPAGAVVGHA